MTTTADEAKKKLNIAIVCDAVTDCVAGSFVSTLRFSERLLTRGHKIIFIAARSAKNPRDNYHGAIKTYRFPALLLPKSEGQLYIAFPRKAELKKIFEAEQIDIVHNMIPTPSSIAATRAARALDIPVVNHSHTQPENLFMHIPSGPWVRFLNASFYRYMSWLYEKGDALIYPSLFSEQLLTGIHAKVEKHIISNGVDLKRFAPMDTAQFHERFKIPIDKTLVLYAGRLHPEKSLDTLISSVPHILATSPDTHFLIVGFGHLENALRTQAKLLGIEKSVQFLGRVTDEEMVMAQHAADIFVLPSLAELEGMVVLEAMAAGNPIVIANSPESASTHFVDGNGFLFEPKNAIDLAEKIVRLTSNPQLRKTISMRSFEMIRAYDIDESVKKLERLYYSLLNERVYA